MRIPLAGLSGSLKPDLARALGTHDDIATPPGACWAGNRGTGSTGCGASTIAGTEPNPVER